MTTTDPTPLAEQIAREHVPRTHPLPGGLFECACDRRQMFNIDAYAAHIATVTERAARERATRAVARMNITGPMRAIFTDRAYREALDALDVLAAQEIETARRAIANGAPDA